MKTLKEIAVLDDAAKAKVASIIGQLEKNIEGAIEHGQGSASYTIPRASFIVIEAAFKEVQEAGWEIQYRGTDEPYWLVDIQKTRAKNVR